MDVPLLDPARTPARRRIRRIAWLVLFSTRISYKVKLTKVALLVGINYAGIKGWDLKGPHNDVRNLKELLIVKRNYLRENVIVLTDEEGTPDDMRPNMRNLRRVLETFVPGHPGCKTFFFAYSGHAAQREETGPTFVEDDHLEEFIIPCDAVIAEEEAGGLRVDNELIITDKELKGYLVNSLSKNAHMTALFDTCHSGTLLNLKHTKCNEFHGAWGRFRRVYGRVKAPADERAPLLFNDNQDGQAVASNTAPLLRSGTGTVQTTSANASPRGIIDHSSGLASTWSSKIRNAGARNHCSGFCLPFLRLNKPQVVCISACKDHQYNIEGSKTGAMIQSIITLLGVNPTPTYREVMDAVRVGSRNKYKGTMRVLTGHVKAHHRFIGKWEPAWLLRWHKKCFNARQDYKWLRDSVALGQEPQLSSHHPLNTKGKFRI